jgi:hypothetical protein
VTSALQDARQHILDDILGIRIRAVRDPCAHEPDQPGPFSREELSDALFLDLRAHDINDGISGVLLHGI